MSKMGKSSALAGVALAVAIAGIYLISVIGGNQGGDGAINNNQNQANNQAGSQSGVDVSATPCDGIGAARTAVNNEYTSRMDAVLAAYESAMEAASDTYWETYRNLETTKWDCEGAALLADPCKALFERSSALAQEILNNIDEGFDEAKAAEREQVKKDYDECLKNPPEEETYEGKKAKCETDFSAGVEAAQTARDQAEALAQAAREQAEATAEADKTSKHATLDAIEEACNIPPPTTGVSAGAVTTGGTGTIIESGNPVCSGRFSGYDPETQAEIDRLRNLYNQARLGDKETGIGGAQSYAAKMNELRQEMAAGPRKCTSDADCGDTTKVCCSETEVGWVVCDGGECAQENEECEDDAICTGKPAQCVSPTTGLMSEPISISKSIILGTPCNNRMRILNLQQRNADSDRFEITGNVPSWLGFSHVGGKLPQDVEITADCSALQTPGTYTASVFITVYDTNNNLINTIPVNITVTVTGSAVIEPSSAAATADKEDEAGETAQSEPVSIAPGDVGFVYNHASPQCPLAITPVVITGPAGSTWTLNSDLPVWLSMTNTSGTVPQTINMNFPCILDQYENQEQSTTLNFDVKTEDGETQNATLRVDGSFTNF